jgi:hypothetical protein
MKRLGIVLAPLLLVLGEGARADIGWQRFIEPELGTEADIPRGLFSEAEPVERGFGQQFTSDDGQAVLAVYSLRNEVRRDRPSEYVRNNFKLPRRAMEYARITGTFFAVSSVRGGQVYYSRCNFSHRSGGAIHCFDLKYPEREKRAWDPIVTRISLSLRPFER